ncbi:MAG: P-loop NTPase fold protein [Candidatus Gracilibacteria bacterium]|nr:P-loop NTPase fold protein [Candidatus Gracilibacteria bacterium]
MDHNPYNAGYYKRSFDYIMKNNKKEFKTCLQKFLSLINNQENQDYIDLEIDKPIISKEEDEKSGLGHYNIAKKVYDLILGIKLESLQNSYSIGIVGEWGIGKSGIVNILKNTWLENRSDFIYYEFNPWNFEKKDLIANFFDDLSKKLGIGNIGGLLKSYSSIISSIESIKSYGFIKDTLSIIIPDKTLDKRKEEINNKLKESNKRIVISIDDLDRCEPDEVIMMLNLIKNLGNFKNIIYLVSYDKENIIRILDEKKFGKDYLDKIINTEIYVQEAKFQELNSFYNKGLDRIFRNIYINSIDNIIEENDLFKIDIKEIFRFIFSTVDGTLIVNGFFISKNLEIFRFSLLGENLRFIKKFLNHLNIILQLIFKNKDTKEQFIVLINDSIKGGNVVYDFISIFLSLNYMKIKDYKFFNLVNEHRNYVRNNFTGINKAERIYLVYDLPKEIKDKSLISQYRDFLKIMGMNISEDNKNGYIDNSYNFYKVTYIIENFTN